VIDLYVITTLEALWEDSEKMEMVVRQGVAYKVANGLEEVWLKKETFTGI